MLDLADVAALDRLKAAEAFERYRLQVLDDPTQPAFDRAYEMLESFFGPRGELEDRSALARFARERIIHYGPGMEGHYRILAAWEGDTLVGVRDCYVDLDIYGRFCVVALSHAFIAPDHRRSGLGAVFRAVPVTLARQTVAERFVNPGSVPIVIAAEMEPADPENPDTIIRLMAYGRSGFKVLDPRRLPYSQPDFREEEVLKSGHTAIPLMAVVRWVDHPEAEAMPPRLAAAFPRLFHVCHRMYLPAWRVDPSEAHALGALARSDADVPMLPLPTGPEQLELLAPLLRGAVMPHYPPGLRGPEPGFGRVEDEMRALRTRWSAAA